MHVCLFVCLSDRKYQRGYHRTYIREIYLAVVVKIYRENKNLLKSDKNGPLHEDQSKFP